MTIQIRTPEEPTEIDADAFLPTEFGNFRIRVTVDEDGNEHCLVYAGDLQSADAPLIRIHSECLTGDAFSSMKCDCGPQLQASLRKVRMMTNNPLKVRGLEENGIKVEFRLPHMSGVSVQNIDYLRTKNERMGHMLELE